MSKIEITSSGTIASVAVDGQAVRCVRRLELEMAASEVPCLSLTLAAIGSDVKIANGEIHIRECLIPEAVERALLSFLIAKYPEDPNGINITTLDATHERRYVDRL